MRQHLMFLGALGLATASAGCDHGPAFSTEARPLTGVCVNSDAALPTDPWMCGSERTAECTTHDGAWVSEIYVVSAQSSGGAACPATAPTLSDPGPFAVGDHLITVTTTGLGTCTSTLTVVDSRDPVGTAHTTLLWPPNHKLQHVAVADCVTVTDDCDANVRVTFTHVASNEVVNATGDGNTDPDIVNLGCDGVDLRAERAGGGVGRIYELGWRAEDASGNVAEGTCQVVVPHDQGGGAPSGAATAYRLDVTGC